VEFLDLRKPLQRRVHRTPERPRSLAVHDPHLQDPPFPAGTEVLGDQVLHVAGVERVEIERPVDRKRDGIRELIFGVVGIRSTHRDPPEEGDRSLRSTGRIVPNLVTPCTGKLRSLLVVLALFAVPSPPLVLREGPVRTGSAS